MSRAEAEEAAIARSKMRRRVMSIVEDQGVYNSSCGYCKSSSRTSVAQGLWAHTLTVDDYQELLNRGWRRSGMFLYKPNMQRTCCPPHSIRLDVNAFVISKEQARVMRRMHRYLEGSYHGNRLSDNQDSGPSSSPDTPSKELVGEGTMSTGKKSIPHDTPELDPPGTAKKKKTSEVEAEAAVQLTASIKGAITRCIEAGSLPKDLDLPQVRVQKVTDKTRGKLKGIEGQLDYTSSVAFAIAAAQKKKIRKASMELEVGAGSEVNGLQPLSSQMEFSSSLVAEILVSQLRETDASSGYIPQACNGHLNFLTVGCRVESNSPSSGKDTSVLSPTTDGNSGAPRKQESQDTGSQGRRFNSSPPSPSPAPLPNERELISPQSCPLPPLPHLKSRHMKIQLKQTSFDPEEFALYKKYQIAVHNDKPEEVKESSYCRFLVDTPLLYVAPEDDGSTPTCGFGSFHQQYRIDGKLVAVGVVDILPNCLSSKYLFWDPDLAFLSLGKYSALQEIKWVQEANKVCPTLLYYYLGFYIHTCPKMRYKAAYAPSELLCPLKYTWVPYEQARPALACSQYLCLSECPAQNGSATESSEKRQEVENMEGSFEIEDDNEEMNSDALIVDAECLALNGEESPNTENGLSSSHSAEKDETIENDEEDEDHSENLGKIIMLLNNKCLTFKRLEEMRVVPPVHMASLAEELTLYMQGVGPELASRMAFVPR
ncbi:hypothetical protein M758_4G195300 [Ceratodon purpureus]|nr:hypothetical protein M758_4G195300 [Ceratodon purpureus]